MGDFPSYKIEEDSKAFASYSKGLVYIGNVSYLKKIKKIASSKDVLIYDERNKEDPDMRVSSSYLIKDDKDIEDIVNILYIYELQHPSNWNRTIDSMIVEWKVHNLLHSIGYKLKRTTDVDLNNEDEIIYNDMVLKFILR